MESVSYDGSRSGGVNWSHPMNNSTHLPPKSPGAASYSMFSSSTSLFESSVPHGHRRSPSAGYVVPGGQQVGGWLSGSSPDVVLKKCSHRRSSSDSVAFVDTSYQYMNYLENVTEEEEFVVQEVPSFPAAFRPAHRRGLSADHGSGDQFLGSHMSYSEKGMRGEHNINREQFQRQFQKPRAEMVPAYNRVVGAKQQQPELTPGKAKLKQQQQVAATSRTESTNSLAGGGGRWSSNSVTFENRSTASESNSHSDDSNDDPRVKSYDRGEDEGGDGEGACTSSTDPVDPKKAKRILANRQSAQRSRVRKLQYISELEMNVNLLETEVASLSPKVGYYDQERKLLSAENMLLKQKLAALAKSQRAKDVYNETLKSELNRLRQLCNQQQQAHQYNTQQQPIQRPVSTDALDLQLLRFSKLDLGPPKIPRGPGRPSLYPNRIPSNHGNSSTNNHGNRVPPSCMAPGGAPPAPFRESGFGQN